MNASEQNASETIGKKRDVHERSVASEYIHEMVSFSLLTLSVEEQPVSVSNGPLLMHRGQKAVMGLQYFARNDRQFLANSN